MTPGVHLCVARPDSGEAKLIHALYEAPDLTKKDIQVAAAGAGVPISGLTSQRSQLSSLVVGYLEEPSMVGCGFSPNLMYQKPDADPAFHGDPVDLSTGEEVYSTSPDITVYNPNGPSVSWGRSYRSLGGFDSSANEFDFGNGWSHSYNIYIVDQTPEHAYPYAGYGYTGIATGNYDYVTSTGQNAPANGWEWQVTDGSGQTVGSSANPNGWLARFQAPYGIMPWQITGPPSFAILVSVPKSATEGAYQARVYVTGANSYFIEYQPDLIGTNQSCSFEVTTTPLRPQTEGNKSLVMPDGARISFTVSTLPDASNPISVCTVESGYGLRIELHYDSNNITGFYRILHEDNTVWETHNGDYVGAVRFWVYGPSNLRYPLAKIIGRTGQSILFEYGNFGWYYYPRTLHRKLEKITDATSGTALLTIGRDSKGFVNQVNDCFGRTVHYKVQPFVSEGVHSGWPEEQYELTFASHIVASTAPVADAPMRVEFGYALIWNGAYGDGYDEYGNPVKQRIPLLSFVRAQRQIGNGVTPTIVSSFEYEPVTCRISRTIDAYGNASSFSETDVDGTPTVGGDHTKINITDATGGEIYTYRVAHSSGRNCTRRVDGGNVETGSRVFGSTDTPNAPTQVTDGNGRTSQFTYDRWGRITSAQTPRGTLSTFNYAQGSFPLNRLLYVQEGSKQATYYEYYEPSGLVQAITTPTPSCGTGEITFTYDALGNVLTVTTPGNAVAAQRTVTFNYTHDGTYSQPAKVGQPLVATDPSGGVTHFRYDVQGRVTLRIDPNGTETRFYYNVAGQILATRLMPTGQTGAGYTQIDNVYPFPGGPLLAKNTFNEAGTFVGQVSFEYGLRNELLRVYGDVPEEVRYTYDEMDRLREIYDGNGVTKSYYGYTDRGLIWYEARPNQTDDDFVFRVFDYDGAGNVTYENVYFYSGSVSSTEKTYQYNDADGSLSDIQYPTDPARNVHFSYDTYGRVTGRTDGEAIVTFGYGDADQLLTTTTAYAGLSNGAPKQIGYTYNADGSRAGMTTPAGAFTYQYDAAGRPTAMTNPLAETTQWAYDPVTKLLASQTSANGVVASYLYDQLGRVLQVTNRKPNNDILSQFTTPGTGGFDGRGNRLQVAATLPDATPLSGLTEYAYNSRDRITGETSARAGGYSSVFGYDGAGNLTNFKGQTRNYDNQNQLTGGQGVDPFTYDERENPVGYNGYPATFDTDDNATAFGTLLTAGYTGEGLRAWKQDAQGERTYYLYDGMTPILELNADGTTRALNTFGASGLVSRNEGAVGSAVYTFDERGSVSERTGAGGSVLTRHVADAYGGWQTFAADGTEYTGAAFDDPFAAYLGRHGYYADKETGLILSGWIILSRSAI